MYANNNSTVKHGQIKKWMALKTNTIIIFYEVNTDSPLCVVAGYVVVLCTHENYNKNMKCVDTRYTHTHDVDGCTQLLLYNLSKILMLLDN